MCLGRDPLAHRAELFDESNVVPLDVQCNIHTSHMVYQGLDKSSTECINGTFSRVSSVSDRLTGPNINQELYVPKCRTDCCIEIYGLKGHIITMKSVWKSGNPRL